MRASTLYDPVRTSTQQGSNAATKNPSLRQRSLSGRRYQRPSVSVPFVLQAHLAVKQAVDNDEVHGCKNYSDAPPDEADRHAVRRGGCVLNGEAVRRVYRWQHIRVDAEDGTGKHPDDVGARREERPPVPAPEIEVDHPCQSCHGQEWQNVPVRAFVEAPEHLWAYPERGRRGDHGEQDGREGEAARDAAVAGVQIVLRLDGDEVRAVHDQRGQGEQPDQDRVPVEDTGGARERAEVRPQLLEEVAAFVQGDAAHHVTEGGAVEDSEQRAPHEECRIPERGPHRVVYVPAQLDGEAPDHQEP